MSEIITARDLRIMIGITNDSLAILNRVIERHILAERFDESIINSMKRVKYDLEKEIEDFEEQLKKLG